MGLITLTNYCVNIFVIEPIVERTALELLFS